MKWITAIETTKGMQTIAVEADRKLQAWTYVEKILSDGENVDARNAVSTEAFILLKQIGLSSYNICSVTRSK